MSVDTHSAASNQDSAAGAHEFVRLVAWRHRYFAAIVIAYGVAALATASLFDSAAVVSRLGRLSSFSILAILCLYGLAWWRPGWIARILPPDGRENGLPSERVLQGLLTVVLLPLFFSSFSVFKILIPDINPFGWDGAFAVWDATLHGGTEPWRLLQPVLGYPAVTVALDLIYAAWFFVIIGAFLWQTFSVTNAERRMRYMLSFQLIWIVIGTLAAILLSSAGPVYAELVTGEDQGFAGLLAYLNGVNLESPMLAVQTHNSLWQAYIMGEMQLGYGISAMPSMHIAAAVLTLLLFWRSGPVARAAVILFVAVIFLGSIHLAWHYAIDGYVAAAMAVVLWKATAPLARLSLAPKQA